MGKIAFLFAGQGSQYPGMAKDLYENIPEVRELFDSAETIRPGTLEQMFSGSEEELKRTENTQPCLFLADLAGAIALESSGVCPDAVAGFSLGEIAGLAASGVLSRQEAFGLVCQRGRFMQEAADKVDGGMVAVMRMDAAQLQELCGEYDVYPVNYNCPGQLVIGGEKAAVEECVRLAGEAGARRSVALAVSGPFHTSLMKPAGDALAEYFKKMDLGAPIVPVLYNYLGKENTENMPIADILVMQVQRSVRMDMILMNLFNKGVRRFIEIGPGKAITGFVKKTAKQLMVDDFECYTIDGAEDLEKVLEL